MGIQSLENGMRVLEAIASLSGPGSLGQIAKLARMKLNKTHRYLVSLIRSGMVSQSSATNLYDFGPSARRIGAGAIGRYELVNVASEHLTMLRERTGYAALLTVWGEAGATVVWSEPGTYPVPFIVRVGAALPLINSPQGLAYLAYLPKKMTQPIIKRQRESGQSEPVPVKEIGKALAKIRATGLSISRSRMAPGVKVVAAPILGPRGHLEAVASLAGPHGVVRGANLGKMIADLRATTAAISRSLGYD